MGHVGLRGGLLAPSITASANAPSEHSIRTMGKAQKAQKAPKHARRGRKDSLKETKAEKEVSPTPMDLVERSPSRVTQLIHVLQFAGRGCPAAGERCDLAPCCMYVVCML